MPEGKKDSLEFWYKGPLLSLVAASSSAAGMLLLHSRPSETEMKQGIYVFQTLTGHGDESQMRARGGCVGFCFSLFFVF